jgi:hypothetical protein
MATLMNAWSSSLGVVTKTASTIVNTVDTVDNAVAMLNDYTRIQRKHFLVASAAREDNFADRLEVQLSQEAAEFEFNANQWAAQNPELTSLFASHRTRIRDAITKAQASL